MRFNYRKTRVIWLLGASTGIGLATAERLLQAGHKLIVSARTGSSLATIAQGFPEHAMVLPCDVTDENGLHNAATIIETQYGHVDTVIFNAGICEYIDNGVLDSALVARVMNTNFLGLVRVAQIAMPLLQRSNNAQFVGVSSSAAYLGLPRAEAYGASKAAMTYFLRVLAIDWHRYGIGVQIISPGFVQTPMTAKNDFPMPCIVSVDYAADCIVKGLASGAPEIHFPKRFTLLLKTLALLPWRVQAYLLRHLVKP